MYCYFGLDDYKIHGKLCLITCLRHGKISYITQIGTGNYNEKTSEQYTDLSLITPHETIGRDAGQIFSALCIGEVPEATLSLWVAPKEFKSKVLEFIALEINRQHQAGDGSILIKVNSLNDMDIMQALVRASQANVPITLFIRGICCLRPGVPGYTDNITIKSLVGRYLEHSRIFVFGKNTRSRMFIGSGDLLNRNTNRRIEVFAEVRTDTTRRQLDFILSALLADTANSWQMRSDGSYEHCQKESTRIDSHQILQKQFTPPQVPDEEHSSILRRLRSYWQK